jgi:hypothetical protein
VWTGRRDAPGDIELLSQLLVGGSDLSKGDLALILTGQAPGEGGCLVLAREEDGAGTPLGLLGAWPTRLQQLLHLK